MTTANLLPQSERDQKIIRLLLAAKTEPRRAPANPELLKELRESGHVILEHPGYPLRNSLRSSGFAGALRGSVFAASKSLMIF